MHEVARPSFGRRPFVVIRPDGYVYANPTRQELEETISELAPQIASAAAGLPQPLSTPAEHADRIRRPTCGKTTTRTIRRRK